MSKKSTSLILVIIILLPLLLAAATITIITPTTTTINNSKNHNSFWLLPLNADDSPQSPTNLHALLCSNTLNHTCTDWKLHGNVKLQRPKQPQHP